MRVLILADAQFATHERALIERVIVGLTIEGVEAQLVLPKERGLVGYRVGLLGEPLYYADRGLMLTRKIRASQIARQISGNADEMTGLIDIVHVMGGGAWGMGHELARLLGAGLVLEVWRANLSEHARGLHLVEDEDRAMFLIPERAFEAQLREALPEAMIRCVPWGAQVPDKPIPVFREQKLISVVLHSSGRQPEQSQAAFDGIADAIAEREDVMIFANSEVVNRAGLWDRVQQRRLTNRFTVIDRSEDRRDLLLRCDLLIYPDTLHEERTLLLDAMGAGMVVIAGDDEMIDPLQDDSGVYIVERSTREVWAAQVRQIIESSDQAKRSSEQARAYVKKHRRSALQIESLSDAYQSLLKQGSRPDQS